MKKVKSSHSYNELNKTVFPCDKQGSAFQKIERHRKDYIMGKKKNSKKTFNKICTSIMNKGYFLFKNIQK